MGKNRIPKGRAPLSSPSWAQMPEESQGSRGGKDSNGLSPYCVYGACQGLYTPHHIVGSALTWVASINSHPMLDLSFIPLNGLQRQAPVLFLLSPASGPLHPQLPQPGTLPSSCHGSSFSLFHSQLKCCLLLEVTLIILAAVTGTILPRSISP